MICFSNFFSFNQYLDFVKSSHEDYKCFSLSLINFLKIKRNNQQLRFIEFNNGHHTNFSNSWNNFLENKISPHDPQYTYLTRIFHKILLDFTFFLKPDSSQSYHSSYKDLISKINQGTFKRHEIMAETFCFDCGQDLIAIFDNWHIKFQILDENRQLINPQKCIEHHTEEKTITFPSGDLIISDWIRLEDFTSLVDKDIEENLNCAKGKIYQTNYYLNKFNFLFIPIGTNANFSIHKNGFFINNDLIENSKNIFLNDEYVTIIDKKNLMEILSIRGYSYKKINNIINQYIKEESCLSLKISPGKYFFNMDSHSYQFFKEKKLTKLLNFHL